MGGGGFSGTTKGAKGQTLEWGGGGGWGWVVGLYWDKGDNGGKGAKGQTSEGLGLEIN